MKNSTNKNFPSAGKNSLSLALIFLFLAFFLTSCVSLDDPETSQEYRAHIVATVNSGHTAGQTLVASRPRINSISVWFQVIPDDNNNEGHINIKV